MGRKIGVFGGTFDPIHTGHLILAEQAREEAGLDEIIFMPAKQSPYKVFKRTTPELDRYNMVSLAIEDNENFSVSDLELNGPEISYTVDTLDKLSKQLNPKDGLYFICGTDAFMGMSGWKNRERLLAEYYIIVGTRPGYMEKEIDEAITHLKQNYSANITKLAMPKLEISSTDIKGRLEQDKSIRYLVSDKVLRYIIDNNVYKKDHVSGVVQTALEMAKIYGVDPTEARLAAKYHDLCRHSPEVKDNILLHGPMAADRLRKEFGIDNEDILNAVTYHTTGRSGMSDLEKIIYVADAVEPGRDYPGVEDLREIAFQDLDQATLEVMKASIVYLKNKGIQPDRNTLMAMEELMVKEGREDGQ